MRVKSMPLAAEDVMAGDMISFDPSFMSFDLGPLGHEVVEVSRNTLPGTIECIRLKLYGGYVTELLPHFRVMVRRYKPHYRYVGTVADGKFHKWTTDGHAGYAWEVRKYP